MMIEPVRFLNRLESPFFTPLTFILLTLNPLPQFLLFTVTCPLNAFPPCSLLPNFVIEINLRKQGGDAGGAGRTTAGELIGISCAIGIPVVPIGKSVVAANVGSGIGASGD